MLEQARHECAVRQLILWRKEWGLKKFRKYLQDSNFSQKVIDDFITQYQQGNTGEHGQWIGCPDGQQGSNSPD